MKRWENLNAEERKQILNNISQTQGEREAKEWEMEQGMITLPEKSNLKIITDDWLRQNGFS